MCNVDKNLLPGKVIRKEEFPHNTLTKREDEIACKDGGLNEETCLNAKHAVLEWRKSKLWRE